MELRFVVPNMEKTFGNLEFAGENTTEQQRINGRMARILPANLKKQLQSSRVNAVAEVLLFMIRQTARALAQLGRRRVGVLATDGTIQTGLYQSECAALGIEAVAPAPDIQALVMSIIYDEIKKGEKGSREKFAAIDRSLRALGCDAAILGCTELSVYRVYHGLPDFYVDAMEVLVEQAITTCGKRLRTV